MDDGGAELWTQPRAQQRKAARKWANNGRDLWQVAAGAEIGIG
ncbi:hypothetical protein CGLO_11594 [Colletotrichum gloeosporioides Cg-14]|uniref:Uncharacterized protein n=1 Tax=Colletotrichum gloeosporioides (strain Cg-14) TaxID=1237896 RepID=T0K7X7_COLGC|nr:hypothetical protein CGLO_11594 [Colletotrichum gloeosporioides Cg-14]